MMKSRQFVVFGLGRFGSSIAQHLCQLGHEVLAVDSSEAMVEANAPFVTQAVQADATDEDNLRSLDVGGFDTAVVAMGSSVRDSILITVLCKEIGVPQVIAKAVDDLHAKVLRKVGADRVVFPERDMGQRVARTLDTPNILDLMDLTGDYRIAEICVPESWRNRTLMEINVRRHHGLSVIGVRRGNEFLASPGAEMRLMEGDVLLVLGREQDIERI